MATMLGCDGDSLPFVYLGMPIGGGTKRINLWQPLVDKTARKLANWKSNLMSIGGRLILSKSVLGSLGTYLFSMLKAPVGIINKLESMKRRFFWGGKEQQQEDLLDCLEERS